MCKYCNNEGGITTIIDRVSDFDEVTMVYIKKNELFLEASGEYYASESINYCPMCGRKL